MVFDEMRPVMEALNCWSCLNLSFFPGPQFFHELSLKELPITLEEFLDELRSLLIQQSFCLDRSHSRLVCQIDLNFFKY